LRTGNVMTPQQYPERSSEAAFESVIEAHTRYIGTQRFQAAMTPGGPSSRMSHCGVHSSYSTAGIFGTSFTPAAQPDRLKRAAKSMQST
jgi:hypothetical protein